MRNKTRYIFGLTVWAIPAIFGCADQRRAVTIHAGIEDCTVDRFHARRITSDHFVIYSTLEDRTFEEALPAFLEAAYKEYENTLPSGGTSHKKLTVYLFGLRKQWRSFVRLHYPSRFALYDRIRTGGFTEGVTSVSFYMNRSTTLATLAHEGWHQYVGARTQTTIPAWLNEGLACYFESVDYSSDQPRFTPQKKHVTHQQPASGHAARHPVYASGTRQYARR